MPEPYKVLDARPLGTPAAGAGDGASMVLLALLSSLDPVRLETALTAALTNVFRADRCSLVGDELTTEFRTRLAQESKARGEALSVEGMGAALCAPLADGAIILERTDPFSKPELALLASLAPHIGLGLRNAKLFGKATTDDLTALPDRKRFIAELEDALAVDAPLALILVDVDHLKDKNDVYGRVVGDRALSELGAVLKALPVLSASRAADDEFALLLRVDAAHARDFAEDFRKLVDNRVFDETGEGIHLTVSIGIAERKAGEMPSGLFARAAEALSASKRDGRNRVTLAR
ncbi:MAG TPA: GGDEF domain-containing protein [Planctomycetota bacterium]|nr:GGDEF domain-containing protein [Planctomycetota bacterium]